MSNWIKQLPYDGEIHQGCLSCPPVLRVAPMSMPIAVGFGCAMVTKDNEIIFMENSEDETIHILEEYEAMAKEDPDHDWQVTLLAPLRGRVYQRHGDQEWVLISSDEGFA